MPWHTLRDFRDEAVPKLHNLRRAQKAGLRVPRTVWCLAAEFDGTGTASRPPEVAVPLIVRSGSPDEDTTETSNAGQLVSAVVTEGDGESIGAALSAVAVALREAAADGAPGGVVFVQPLVEAIRSGIAFFDGFHYERTTTPGGNADLTAGRERGDVERGHLERSGDWSDWLRSVWRVFGRESGPYARLDIEFAESAEGYVLLQVRPALFPVRRNPTLSLANHREILGDPPSPWIVSVLGTAGEGVLDFFARFDPGIAEWDERYCEVLAGRAWMNFGVFFRLMDRWGLPRTFVTEGVGGRSHCPADGRMLWRRALPSAWRLVRLQIGSVLEVLRAPRHLRELDRTVDGARDLPDLWHAHVQGLALALRTNFAIGGVLSGVQRLRRMLGIRGTPTVVTGEMMHRYDAIRALPMTDRETALDRWLGDFGHRGPLESDPARPRFAEMRDALLTDVLRDAPAPPAAGSGRAGPLRFLFWIDARREWFRDELMRRWQRLRRRMLEEADALVASGSLAERDDVFLLTGADVATPADLREAVARNRRELETARRLRLPDTAPRDEILDRMRTDADAAGAPDERRTFSGIGLDDAGVEGEVVRADDLASLLVDADRRLGPGKILVVPTLEPSWAVVFGRVAGVVSELGGELSHASILLREARKPAVVNCAGVYDVVRCGDRIRLDGARGLVHIREAAA